MPLSTSISDIESGLLFMRQVFIPRAIVRKEDIFRIGNHSAMIEIRGEKQSYHFQMKREELVKLQEALAIVLADVTT